jgi:hypothetical protein
MFKHHGLRTRGPMLRTAPVDGGAGGADPTLGGGGAPAATATPPADLLKDPAVQAAIAKATADAEAKARLGTKENGKKEALEELKNALGPILGLKPAEVDPAALGAQLAEARESNAKLMTEVAVGRSARVAGGDEDMVTAWLSHKGLLKGLDPAAADFADKVDALVKAQIEANPKLKAGDVAPVAPVVTPTAAGANDTARPSMTQAIQAQMAGLKK